LVSEKNVQLEKKFGVDLRPALVLWRGTNAKGSANVYLNDSIKDVTKESEDDEGKDADKLDDKDADKVAGKEAAKDASDQTEKEDCKDATKDAGKETVKDTTEKSAKEKSTKEPNEAGDATHDAAKGADKEIVKESSQDASKDEAAKAEDATKDATKDLKKDTTKYVTKEATRDATEDATKDSIKESTVKDADKGEAKDANKESAKDTSKDATKATDDAEDTARAATNKAGTGKGTFLQYHGLDSAEEVVRWTWRKVAGPLRASNPADLHTWLKAERCLVVGFFNDLDSAEAEVFITVARDNDDTVFVVVTTPELMTAYHQSHGSILVMKSYEEKEAHFLGRLEVESLKEFVAKASRPLVMEFGQRLAGKVLGNTIRSHFLFISHKMDKEHRERMTMVRYVSCFFLYFVFVLYR
jgi:hypothetical protein